MSLRHCLLGLLAIRPMSGYTLKQVIDTSVAHFWSADQSQIYRTLARLEEDGLVARQTVVQADRPNLHIHSVTPAGGTELDAWLASPPDEEVTREPFLARLFFAERLGSDGIARLLAARRAQAIAMLGALEAIPVPDPPHDLGVAVRLATRANGIAHARAEITWIDLTAAGLGLAGA